MVLAYLSGPIIHSEFRQDDLYQVVIKTLEERGVSVFAPQFLPPADSHEIYQRDVDQVRACDFLVAEVSNPSLGVGMEIMLAIELSKPIIMFYNKEMGRLSKMVRGAPGKVIFSYTTIDEVVKILGEIDFKNLIVCECQNCDSGVSMKNETDSRCLGCSE